MPGTPTAPRGRWRSVLPWALAVVTVGAVAITAPVDARGEATEAIDVLGGGQLRIMAPADPGGGWDQTSRELQASLRDVVGRTEVYNVGGAGGTIGLSQFNGYTGDPTELMTTGAIMVGAIESNASPVSLDDVTPLARLTTDYVLIAVPADSPIQTLQDLADEMTADLGAVSFAGGSAGGVEQILAGLMALELGLDPDELSYVAHSGGGEALTTVLSGRATAALSGVSEIEPQVRAGTLRALAVSSPERLDTVPDVPTMQEAGLDVELPNWRGVVAPAGIDDEERAALVDILTEMHESPAWADALERRGWEDSFLTGPEFEEFIASERETTYDVLDQIGLIP